MQKKFYTLVIDGSLGFHIASGGNNFLSWITHFVAMCLILISQQYTTELIILPNRNDLEFEII